MFAYIAPFSVFYFKKLIKYPAAYKSQIMNPYSFKIPEDSLVYVPLINVSNAPLESVKNWIFLPFLYLPCGFSFIEYLPT